MLCPTQDAKHETSAAAKHSIRRLQRRLKHRPFPSGHLVPGLCARILLLRTNGIADPSLCSG